MLPVKLKIQGVNSYIKEQVIDFDKLLESKIFGIFGEVGSGKSTILEAMSYALYNKYDKLRGERVAYNLMNLKSSRFLIDFEFLAGDNDRYRFVVEGRRNSKRYEDVTTNRKYYKWEGGQWMPKEKLDAAEITGLSFENFNRTIIIPQGKFMEFINLSGKERTKMLKEIFNLHKYDLLDKVGILEKENEKELSNLEGQLTSLLYVDKELIAANEKALEEIRKSLDNKKKLLKAKDEEFKILERLKNDFLKLKNLEKEYALLSERKDEIQSRKKQVEEYEFCRIEFKSGLEISDNLTENINKLTRELDKEQDTLQSLSRQLKETQAELENVNKEYEKLDDYKKQEKDYSLISRLKSEKQKLSDVLRQAEKLQESLEAMNKEADKLQSETGSLKKEIAATEQKMPDAGQLAEIHNWFSELDRYNREGVELINSITNKRLELRRLQNSVDTVVDDEEVKALMPPFEDKSPEEIISYLESLLQERKETLKQLQNRKNDLALKAKLKEFAASLEEGKPCPVCGSTQHPNPLKPGNIDEDLAKVEKLIATEEALIKKLESYLESLRQLKLKIQNVSEIVKEKERKYEQLKQDLEQHQKLFKWKDYSPERPEEIMEAFENAKRLKQKLIALRKELEEKETKSAATRRKLDSVKEQLAGLKNRAAGISASNKTLEGQLSIADYSDFEDISIEEIEKSQKELKQKIANLEKLYTSLTQKYNDLNIKEEKQKTLLENMRKTLDDTKSKQKEINDALEEKIKKSKYSNLDEVKKILGQNLDTASIRKEIEKFEIKLQSTESELQNLKKNLEDKKFEESHYEQIKSEIEKLKKEYELLIEEKSKLEDLIARQKKDLQEKERLLKEKEKRELRAADLKVMRSLFTGSGFVNYISTVRLEEVVNYANSRFIKLTRGRLKLQLNKDNSFDVIDFLNDGKRRSIKTLSGGQSFQASLSLALALASIVQQQNKTEQNFFFLDEGFGTQDEDSLHLVFDTIKSLRKENRLVGLISHVAALKEEVSTYLEVVYDEEEGSKILKSWEK